MLKSEGLLSILIYRRLGFLSACAYFKNCKEYALKSQLRLKIERKLALPKQVTPTDSY